VLITKGLWVFGQALDSYLETFPLATVNDSSKLSHKLKEVATDLINKKHLPKEKLKGAFTASTMKDSIFSINTFNAYVHNKDFHPEPESLKKNWDNLEIFFIKIWELI
jgi:predicted AAA+ superfamily ATPase